MERFNREYHRPLIHPDNEHEPLPESIVKKYHSEARERLVARFSKHSLDEMAYHNLSHTNSMSRRAQAIGEIMRDTSGGKLLSGRDLQLIDIATSWHDVVQDNEPIEEEESFLWEGKEYIFIKKKRKRDYGGNEAKSARELSGFIDQVQAESGMYLSEADRELMDNAIMATVPYFDTDLGTVRQPNLGPKPHPIALAVAMGDLATAPMEGRERFLEEGIALFNEDNLDIKEELLLLSKRPVNYQVAWTEYIRARMLASQLQQLRFVKGRQALFAQDIASLPEVTKRKLKDTFLYFNESIEAQESQIEASKVKPIENLLQEYHYLG